MNHKNRSITQPVRTIRGWRSRFYITLLGAAGLIFSLSVSLQDSSSSNRKFEAAIAASDPVIAAAGDIACDPTNSSFNGGNGTSGSCRQKYTSDLLVNGGYAAVLALGDNQYYCGGYQAFLQSYDLSWGRVKSITRPAVGNHEYLTSGGTDCTNANTGAAGYFQYFGAAAGDPSQGYYSYDIGAWHLIALNSNCSSAGGCSSSSPQGQWLAADLAAHPNICTLAYWHIPLFSSGGRASSNTQSFWQTLYNNNADLILTGHDHIYERFAPQTPSGTLDTVRGIREFVVGSGGANHTSLASIFANSEVRNDNTYGILKLTLHPTSYDWQFIPEAGASFTDSGTTNCHGQTSDITAPTTPGNLAATAIAPNQVNLAWTVSTDNVGVVGYQVFRDNIQIATASTNSYSDTTVQPQSTHTYKVIAFDAGGNFSAASNNASATTPADTTSPTAPTNLAATTTGLGQVSLTWTASTDNVAVTGYRIIRNSLQIATTSTTSFTDTTVAGNTTYNYYVTAFDSTGNPSGPSNSVNVTTPTPPTTLTFNPTADTYVQSDMATTNFGPSTQVVVDNSPFRNMLLKFTVSGIGTRTVVNAKLRVYCEDGSSTGGAFYRVADNTWTESAVTWNTAPASDAASLATLGTVAVGNWYEVDVTSLVSGDGTFSLKGISTSSDGAYYSSKEGPAGFAPQLVVTTSAAPTPSPSVTPTRTPTATATGTSTPTSTATGTASPTATFTSTPQASVIFSDGFESGDLSQWTNVQGLVVQNQDVLNGIYAARGASVAGGAAYARKTLAAAQTELYYQIRFKVISQDANTVNLMKFRTATDLSVLSVSINMLGQLSYRNDVTGTSINSTVTVSPGIWQTLQVHVRIADTTSQVQVWYNNVLVGALSQTESLGINPIGRLQLGENTPALTYDIAFDDVIAASGFIPAAPTPTPTNTATNTPTSTATETPTNTPTGTATVDPSPTQTDISTPTDTPTETTTSTPAPTNTSTPTSTPTNTATPTNTFTPTVTPIPVVDPIFTDGFESGSLSAWSASLTDGGSLSVSSAAALIGGNGLQAVINDNNPIYVTDNTPDTETRYRARFYFDPNSIVMADRDAFYLFTGFSTGASTGVVRVEFRFYKGSYQLRAGLRNDGGGWTNSNWMNFSDTSHSIEFDWQASTSAVANNGSLTLWIDGGINSLPNTSLTGVDNDTRRIINIQLGAVSEIDPGTRGTLYFDAFESRRLSYIGP